MAVPSLPDARREVRCPHCGRLLFRAREGEIAEIEIKCDRCRNIVVIVTD